MNQYLQEIPNGIATTITSLLLKVKPKERQQVLAEASTNIFREETAQAKERNSMIYNPIKSLTVQCTQLIGRGYDIAAKMSQAQFSSSIHALQEQVKDLEVSAENNIPYILVIPREIVSLEVQLSSIGAQNFLGTQDFIDQSGNDKSTGLYLITDVSAGESLKGCSFETARERLKNQVRFPTTLEESVALLTQLPLITYYHSIVAAGILHKGEYAVELYNAGTDHGKPCIKVKRETQTLAAPNRGFPSYAQRIVA